jgi:uncharacterized low-complexity protein
MNGKKTALSLAIGSAFAVTLVAAPAANAAENPFGMSALKSGYLLAAADEAKPAAKPMEGKCGGMKDEKAKDGKCGGMKDAKAKDGKCGEGKCGGAKKDAKAMDDKKDAKTKAGKKADMKATDKKMPEGKCGEGKCGGKKKADDKAAAPAAGDKK